MTTLKDLIRDYGALDRAKHVRSDILVYQLSEAGNFWGASAAARSNYASLVREYKDQTWCVMDPPDGPLYVQGHYGHDGTYIPGHDDDTPPWESSFDRAALVFFGGEVYVNASFQLDELPEEELQSLREFAWLIEGLSSYPIVDDDDFYALEHAEVMESLADLGAQELPGLIADQHEYGQEALDLVPDFVIKPEAIVAACAALGVSWETETASDGATNAYIRHDDLERIAKHLTPPWFKAAADGLKWAALGYPRLHEEGDDYKPSPSLQYVKPGELREYWLKERKHVQAKN